MSGPFGRMAPLSWLLLSACAAAQPRASSPPLALAPLCAHQVDARLCVRCRPELAAPYRRQGDWCPEHALPESQCLICHPELKFYELPPLPAEADVRHLSREGEDVPALEAHASPGKVTVFDFYAHWCAPCRQVDAYMAQTLGTRRDLALRKLNVMSWESPLAARYLGQVQSLPYLVVLGKDGRVVARISGLDLDRLAAAIEEGAR